MINANKNTIELYIHIPFCVKKCFYCDFLSFRALAADHEAYVDQLVREIRARGAFCSELTVSTVFIGGGTPTVMEPELIRRIMEAVKENFTLEPDAEITIEANPGTLLYNKLPVYHDCGINRVSIGLQSADNQELKNLGRVHSFEEFLKSYQSARMSGFTNISVDLMSGIPGQTLESWKNTLKKVTMLKPEHISAYSLIIEEGTPFASRTLNLPDEDAEYNMYEATAQILREYGFEQYEISNYAKKGRECRHNVGYWIRQDYLGFGLGASSLYGKERFANTQDMKKYLENSRTPEKIREKEPPLTREDEMAEFMFLGLRMTRGISKAEFERQFGSEIDAIYGDVLRKYKSMGLLLEENGRIFLSREGIHVSNSVMADFLP